MTTPNPDLTPEEQALYDALEKESFLGACRRLGEAFAELIRVAVFPIMIPILDWIAAHLQSLNARLADFTRKDGPNDH